MSSTPPAGPRLGRNALLVVAALALAVLLALALRGRAPTGPASPAPAGTEAAARPQDYVGSAACAQCHAEAYRRWQGSQHAVAMQPASDGTVLGDFDDARYTADGVTTEFFRRDGRYFIRTEGPDGGTGEFEVRHVFGVYPLQQYLVELPRGHVQAFTVAWDARPTAEGGQRWFTLYPGERIDPRDELHWSRRQQNWNYMCADCHSTRVRKNYDAATDAYRTTYAEISVGCEACHGPGSGHVRAAEAARKSGTKPTDGALAVALDERKGVRWTIDPATGNARRSAPRSTDREIGACAQCHARRGQFSDADRAGEPFTDHYRPALLTAGLYHPDGQQRDEVYDWGSFLSSRMHAQGVTCSDCHDPHDGKPRAAGDALCAQCHLATRYAAPAHHFHPAGGEGSACTDCHMRTTTYMVVDPRHDHSFRIPRPDLTATLGVPNACNDCHRDRSPQWAAAEVRKRYPEPKTGYQGFAEAFAASDAGRPATLELTQVVANDGESAIARASALSRLAAWPGENSLLAAEAALEDPSPLVRLGALEVYQSLPPAERRAVIPRLADPSRVVRMEAARTLAALPPAALGPDAGATFARAAAEYVAAERFNADRPENRTNLGGYFGERGEFAAAEAEFRAALALDERFVPAWVNLADLLRTQGREPDAERVLRDGLKASPDDPSLHHALGLSLVRQQRLPEALPELARAAALAPDNARLAYVHAVALHSVGRTTEALRWLERALARAPADRDVLSALVALNAEAGHAEAARRYDQRLRQLDPAGAPSGGR